jgi:GT2 family glycosyltransferase
VQISYRPKPTLGALLHRTCLFRWTGLFRGAYKKYRRWHFDAQRVQPVEVLMGAAMLVRRDRFRELGGWDEDFRFGGEDLELCHRVNRHAPVVYYPEVEITHFGRASTRQNPQAATQIAAGLVQYLRKTGCSRAGILCYKTAVTLDAPLQLVGKSLQYAWRRLRGKRRKAEQSRLVVAGLARFLTRGWLPFWRA